MKRTPDQVISAMASAAVLAPFASDATWREALFEPAPGGWALSRRGDPDRELLSAAAAEYATLDEHLATLPHTLHLAWLRDILRIPRLPAVPDRVVAHVTVDPKLAPAVVASGTLLRGGKDAFGGERRYATLDTLTAHGASVMGVRATVPREDAAARLITAEAPAFPLVAADGDPAPQVLRISSPLLAFPDGSLSADITFATNDADVPVPAGLQWRHPRPDGTIAEATSTPIAGGATVLLHGGCADPDGGDAWVELYVPASLDVPATFSFTDVSVVARRTAIAPQAAFYNDGAVDVSKEFKPFGEVAKRGDAFYLRSDEALSKPLKELTVSVTLMAPDGSHLTGSNWGSGLVYWASNSAVHGYATHYGYDVYDEVELDYADYWDGSDAPSVVWERRSEGQWTPLGLPTSDFTSITADPGGPLASEPFAVSGQSGNYVRAFLKEGDFGWSAYLEAVAAFGAAAANGTATSYDSMPMPPDPVFASAITLTYRTENTPAARVESTSGWSHRVHGGGPFTPFRRLVADEGSTGQLAIGLALPQSALGSTVSLYCDIDSASPCGETGDPIATWQWWDGSAWAKLTVADGTRLLRESGLLRFVAPLDWVDGCSDESAATGRWVRLITNAPARMGAIHAIYADAVIAQFVSAAPDPARDASADTALAPGTIKGTLSPLPGVKKATNVASVRGRAPESDTEYARRASALVRHRGRALTPWDYEQHVAIGFPEVAAVRCLPHTDAEGHRKPGSVGLVLIPAAPHLPQPTPSVSLAGRVVDAVDHLMPMGAKVAILCPDYVPVTVTATVKLRRGVAALDGRAAVTGALETLLHPTGTVPIRWGRSLYTSALIAAMEKIPQVDVVESVSISAHGVPTALVTVDVCRGMYCSSGAHAITCVEQL